MKRLTMCVLIIAAAWTSCSDPVEEVISEIPEEEVEQPLDEPEEEEENIPPVDYYIGALFSFQRNLRNGIDGNQSNNGRTTFHNRALFNTVELGLSSGTPNQGIEDPATKRAWWDNLVEEMAYSGLDYVAANCRGIRENPDKYRTDAGNPAELKEMIAAMKRRTVSDRFKIAIFDDCPASWEAARNEALGRGYAGYNASNPENRKPHPLRTLELDPATQDFKDLKMFNDSVYKYIWELNLKVALKTLKECGEEYIFKIDNRPVIFFWGIGFIDNDNDHSDCNGKLLAIVRHLRKDCKALMGVEPFLILDQAWEKYDTKLSLAPEVDAMNDWFTIRKGNQPSDSYKVRTFNGYKIGTGVPSFSVDDLSTVNEPMFVDAKHGQTLITTLEYFVEKKVHMIFLEGFTDVAENAALWRSSDQTFYDYPNQRLNILRRFSKDPYPKTQKLEAEACDYCYDSSIANDTGTAFSKKMVKPCNDTNYGGGWMVENLGEKSAANCLKWKELPLRKGKSILKIRYTATQEATVLININGKRYPNADGLKLPATGKDNWRTIEIGEFNLNKHALLDLIVAVKSNNINLNYLKIENK